MGYTERHERKVSRMIEKRTILKEVSLSGMGVHTGENVRLTLKPASSGKVVFFRLDLGGCRVEVDARRAESGHCTSLVDGPCVVRTIEHLLAVLLMLGIDSLDIEIYGSEIPILDGSALPIARAILKSGVGGLPERKKVLRILKAHTLCDGQASLSFSPDDDFRLTYVIDFPHPAIGRQAYSAVMTRESFLVDIAPARTFGFLKDVPELWRKGLARGGTLKNAVVLDEERVVSGPLRFPDEFVRHKMLDLIGDLALLGHPLLGHFRAEKAGHRLHREAVCFLLEHPDFWTYEEQGFPSYLET